MYIVNKNPCGKLALGHNKMSGICNKVYNLYSLRNDKKRKIIQIY